MIEMHPTVAACAVCGSEGELERCRCRAAHCARCHRLHDCRDLVDEDTARAVADVMRDHVVEARHAAGLVVVRDAVTVGYTPRGRLLTRAGIAALVDWTRLLSLAGDREPDLARTTRALALLSVALTLAPLGAGAAIAICSPTGMQLTAESGTLTDAQRAQVLRS